MKMGLTVPNEAQLWFGDFRYIFRIPDIFHHKMASSDVLNFTTPRMSYKTNVFKNMM